MEHAGNARHKDGFLAAMEGPKDRSPEARKQDWGTAETAQTSQQSLMVGLGAPKYLEGQPAPGAAPGAETDVQVTVGGGAAPVPSAPPPFDPPPPGPPPFD
jgi:hypothetical protein